MIARAHGLGIATAVRPVDCGSVTAIGAVGGHDAMLASRRLDRGGAAPGRGRVGSGAARSVPGGENDAMIASACGVSIVAVLRQVASASVAAIGAVGGPGGGHDAMIARAPGIGIATAVRQVAGVSATIRTADGPQEVTTR